MEVIINRRVPYLIGVEFAIRTNIEQAAGGVVGTGTESISIWEELNSVDIGFVASKGLHSLASTDIPQFGESVASTRHKDVLVGRVDANRHDVAEVIGEFGHL